MRGEDEEYEELVRREAVERVDRIVRAMKPANGGGARWDDVYRQAHTLAGIAPDLDPGMAFEARRLCTLLRDERGHAHQPSEAEAEEARRLTRRLSARVARAPSGEGPGYT